MVVQICPRDYVQRLLSCGPGFESQAHNLGFSNLYSSNLNSNMKRTKIKLKEAGIGPFYKKRLLWWNHYNCNMFNLRDQVVLYKHCKLISKVSWLNKFESETLSSRLLYGYNTINISLKAPYIQYSSTGVVDWLWPWMWSSLWSASSMAV